MDQDRHPRLPELDITNYAPWYFALETYSITIKANNHLISNPDTPIDPAILEQYTHRKSKLLSAILSSVPADILGLILVPGDRPTPFDLVSDIIKHIDQATKDDHKFLKTEAENVPYTTDMNIDEYIKNHTAIRQKMIAARYPNIKDEETTVEFIITGLKKDTSLTPILGPIVLQKPQTVKDFVRNFKELHTLYKPAHGWSSKPPTPTQFTGDYNNTRYMPQYGYRGRNQYRRQFRPYRRGSTYPRRLPAGATPCRFHTSLGILSAHTDEDCQDKRHPKYQSKAQAYYTNTNDHSSIYYHQPPIFTRAHSNHFTPTTPIHPRHAEASSEADTEQNGTYILDSGAHPTHLTEPTDPMKPLPHPILTTTANNMQTPCTHHGTIRIRPRNSNHDIVTYAIANEHIKHNLLSVRDLATRYGQVTFTPHREYVMDNTSSPLLIIDTAPWVNNQYRIRANKATKPTACTARTITYQRPKTYKPIIQRPTNETTKKSEKKTHHSKSTTAPPVTTPKSTTLTTKDLSQLRNPARERIRSESEHSLHNWHLKLNHAHPTKIALTAKHRLIPNMPNTILQDSAITCCAYQHSKLHPAPHKRTAHNYPPGAYISSDTCGPITPTSTQGNNHILVLICATTRYVIAHFLKDRKDIPPYIYHSLHNITTTLQLPLTHFRTDNAKEYTSKTMQAIYHKYRLHHQLRTPQQPQENPIAERFNRTVMNAVRASLTTANLTSHYWEDAARDAILKYNIMHHAAIGTSPHHRWYGKKPVLPRIFIFGQLGTIPICAPKKKLYSRADPARYMYATDLKHIVVLNLRTNQYQPLRAIAFHPYHRHKDPTYTTGTAFKAKASTKQAIPKSIQIDTQPPRNVQQARQYPDAPKWQEAHDKELTSIDQHESIQWLPENFTPPPTSVIPLMKIYRYKRSAEGHILQRKARCNLRGDLMKLGIHYDPEQGTTCTADRTTQRMLIAIHAAYGFPLEHFDIKSAYLHEQYRHHRPVYVRQIANFDGTYRHPGNYGRLRGNLYGSPPAAYLYNHGLQKCLTHLGFTASEHDPCLYTKSTTAGHTIVSTTIDDFLVLGTTQSLIQDLYQNLLKKYKVKRLDKPQRFLNWTIKHNPDGTVHVSQPDVIDALLQQTSMHNCNPTKTPYNQTTHLDNQPETEPLPPQQAKRYRQILGEIRYITDSTRPDIMYAANCLAQYMKAPQQHHAQALKTLLRYLKGTRNHGLTYRPLPDRNKQPHELFTIYSDADYANAKNRKSVTGNVHLFNGTPISWFSRKQNVVALSTTEAEYISATNATQHTKWLRNLLQSAKVPMKKTNQTLHRPPLRTPNSAEQSTDKKKEVLRYWTPLSSTQRSRRTHKSSPHTNSRNAGRHTD